MPIITQSVISRDLVAGRTTQQSGTIQFAFQTDDATLEPSSFDNPSDAQVVTITFSSFSVGADATNTILEADPSNSAPPDGVTYALFYALVENTGASTISVDSGDFALVGSGGRVWRSAGLTAPEPALQVTLEPGASGEGWVACRIGADDNGIVAWFDHRELSGNWSDRYIAAISGTGLPSQASPISQRSQEGTTQDNPAGIGDSVVTDDWVLTLEDVVYAQDVYNLYGPEDYRTTALGDAAPELVDAWIGLRFSLVNNQTGSVPAHFPATAISLAYADGTIVNDVRLLSPPMPELHGDYFPGGSGTGWITIELPAYYDGSLLRFESFQGVGEPRFFTWGDGSAPASAGEELSTPEPASAQFEPGTIVAVTDDHVNLREGPGSSFEVVGELAAGDEVTIDAGPEEADGYSWYQITAVESGASGYVASNFLRAET